MPTTITRKHLSLGLCGGLLLAAGCAGPPPAPAAPKPTVASIVGDEQVIAEPAKKVFGVLFDGDVLPDTDALENALARRQVLADVRGTSQSVEIGSQGVVCELSIGAPPDDVPDPGIHPELAAQGLSVDEATAMHAAKASITVVCVVPEGTVRSVLPVAEAVAEAVADLSNGHLFDPQTGRYWPQAEWQQSRAKSNRFAIERAVRVLRTRASDGTWCLATRGLGAFGRVELDVFPVPAEVVDQVEVKLRVLADVIIEEPKGPGSTVALGPVAGVLMDRARYAATLPDGTVGKDVSTPGEHRVALADPRADVGDAAAQAHFYFRLSR